MAMQPRNALNFDQILRAVDQLSLAQVGELERRLAARRTQSGDEMLDEANLMRAANRRLPARAERRLKCLIARSERGTLTPGQLAEYQSLAQEVQHIDGVRANAIAELARRWKKSPRAVMARIASESSKDGP